MKTLRLIRLALKYNWDAQRSNPVNLIAGVVGMVINNLIVLWGLWVMLFDGKPDGQKLTVYFLSLNAMVTIAWGMVTYFFGGVRSLGQYIEEGSLEPMLATPRDPLLLASLSNSITPGLGDILQGLCNLVALFFLAPLDMALRCVLFTAVSSVAIMGVFIATGSIPFFVSRGNALGHLLLECNLSLSFYPTGKVFSDWGRVLLFLTPAAVMGVLPIEAVESGSFGHALAALLGALGFFWVSVQIFRLGLRRYQSASYVVARN